MAQDKSAEIIKFSGAAEPPQAPAPEPAVGDDAPSLEDVGAGAFLRAGVVHRVLAYVAPILLGGPVTAVDDVGVATIAGALRWDYDDVQRIGPDVLLSLVPGR